jgi:hypothetical protein
MSGTGHVGNDRATQVWTGSVLRLSPLTGGNPVLIRRGGHSMRELLLWLVEQVCRPLDTEVCAVATISDDPTDQWFSRR